MSIINLELLKDPLLSLPCLSDENYFPRYINKRVTSFLNHIKLFEGEIGKMVQNNFDNIESLFLPFSISAKNLSIAVIVGILLAS